MSPEAIPWTVCHCLQRSPDATAAGPTGAGELAILGSSLMTDFSVSQAGQIPMRADPRPTALSV